MIKLITVLSPFFVISRQNCRSWRQKSKQWLWTRNLTKIYKMTRNWKYYRISIQPINQSVSQSLWWPMTREMLPVNNSTYFSVQIGIPFGLIYLSVLRCVTIYLLQFPFHLNHIPVMNFSSSSTAYNTGLTLLVKLYQMVDFQILWLPNF